MADKWVLYLIVAVLGFFLGMYVLVSIVSWVFKALLIAIFILFVFIVFRLWNFSRRRREVHR